MKKGTFIRTQADLNAIIANENFKPTRYCSVGGDVINFENCYINPNGDIIRLSNYTKKYGYEITARLTRTDVLTGSVNNTGYVIVSIAGKSFALHRLVASTFLKDDPNKREIDHVDGDKLNNTVTNLEYVTKKENMQRYWTKKNNAKKENNTMEKTYTWETLFEMYKNSDECLWAVLNDMSTEEMEEIVDDAQKHDLAGTYEFVMFVLTMMEVK